MDRGKRPVWLVHPLLASGAQLASGTPDPFADKTPLSQIGVWLRVWLSPIQNPTSRAGTPP